MNRLVTTTAKLIPRSKRARTVPGAATAYYYDPEPGVDLGLGSLFVVIEVLGSSRQSSEVIDLIIEAVGHTYYNQAKPGTTPLQQFEAAIKIVNHELSNYINQGNATWVGKLSAVIAVLAGEELHLTDAGSARAYLYRNGRANLISSGLGPDDIHARRVIFGNIASGRLEAGDHLLFTTPALLHSVAKADLDSILVDNNPNSAIAELAPLIEPGTSDRVAALIAAVTTPEMLALQAKPSEPDTAVLGEPVSVLAGAKDAAVPMVKKSAVTAGKLATDWWTKFRQQWLPSASRQARQTALTGAGKLRQFFYGRRGRRQAAALGVVGLIVIISWLVSLISGHSTAAAEKQFDHIVAETTQAKSQLDNGDKTSARTNLNNAQTDFNALQKSKELAALNKLLPHRPHPEDQPDSTAKLSDLINQLLARLDNLVLVTPSDLTDFASLAGAKPTHLELVGKKLVLIDAAAAAAYEYDLSTNKLRAATANPTALSKTIALVPSSTGNGLYVLTSDPAVWFYNLDDSTLAKQNLSSGDWPKSKSIASYGGNLYLLADDASQVYKFVPTAGGWSAKTPYVAADQTASLAGAAAITVDGSVYAAGSSGISRFFSGKLTTQLKDLPNTLTQPSQLHSYADGSALLLTDPSSGRIGLIGFDGSNLKFTQQFSLSGSPKVYETTYDASTKTAYVLTDGKILKFTLSLQ